jgi:rhamnose transport system substrate-binding protein
MRFPFRAAPRYPALLLLAALTALTGCQSSQDTGAAAPAGSPGAPAPSRGGTLKLGMMPKNKGIPYFNAAEKGAREAAEALGDVELTYDGPLEDRSEAQSSMLDTWIVRRFDALAVACNDPEQIATTLARARDENLTVITWDADANPASSRRQFFVNQVDGEELARALVDEMAQQAGEDARVAVVSSSPTAPNQTAWLKLMEAYRAERYPKMSPVGRIIEYAGENQARSKEKAQSILKAYPDVRGIWGMTSVAFPGAADAVREAGRKGEVAVVGLATPNDMKQFVHDGVVKSVFLWNVVDLGYLTVHVARAVARGELREGATTFSAGRLGEVKVRGQEVLLGKPMRFDASNIDQFDF